MNHKLLIFLSLTFTLSLETLAQKEFIYAREFQQITKKEISVLNIAINNLNDREKADWRNMEEFLKNPVAYVSDTNKPPFDPLVYLKLKDAQTDANLLLLERQTSGVANQGEFPAGILPTAELTSKIIYATGQLLVERAKQELYTTHFQQMKAAFEKKHRFRYLNPGRTDSTTITFSIKDILPNSYLIIADFNALTQPQVGASLQKAFEQDLQQLRENMSKHLLPEAIKAQWPYLFLDAALEGAKHLNEGLHPSGVLKELAFRYNEIPSGSSQFTPKQQLSTGLNMLNIISESLMAIETSTAGSFTKEQAYWVTRKAFADLGINGYEYYICLLYLNHRDLFHAIGIDQTYLQRGTDKYLKLKSLVEQVLTKVEWLDSKIAELKTTKIEDKSVLIVEYSQAIISLLDMLKPMVCEYATAKALCEDFDALKPQINTAITIPADIKNGDYAEVFLKSYRVVEAFYNHYSKGKGDPFAGDAEIIKYLTLANDILQADSVEGIKNVLDEAILPVGSFALKRNLKYTTTINGYVGITGGGERILGGDYENNWGGHFGPFAPIGIDLSWASSKKRSNGVFLALVDLGAVVNMYFRGDDKITVEDSTGVQSTEEVTFETLPDLKLKHIFAPGLFYVHGLKDSPISFGLGIQLAPDLREVTLADGTDLATENSIRYSAFLAIDVPLFTIRKGGKR